MAKKKEPHTYSAHRDMSQHWEQKYDPTPRGKSDPSGIRNFDPMPSKDRPHTHQKINECDH
jgi:hypothetical protein